MKNFLFGLGMFVTGVILVYASTLVIGHQSSAAFEVAVILFIVGGFCAALPVIAVLEWR